MSRSRRLRILSGPRGAQGFTLVEVMVSSALLGLVALGSASLLVAMGRAVGGARGVTYSDILLNNLRSQVMSVNGFAQTKMHSVPLQNCTNPNAFAAGSCNTTVAAPNTTPYSPQGLELWDGKDNRVAGPPGTPRRYTRALAFCATASPDCLLEAYATFLPVCPICPICTLNCARAEMIVFEITVRQAPGVNAPGGRLKDITTTVAVRTKDVAEATFYSGVTTWTPPKEITNADFVLIGGGAGGGYNDADILDTYDHEDNIPPVNFAGRGASPPAMERQYAGGPGGSSGEIGVTQAAVNPALAYTVTAGVGGLAETNGGASSVTEGGGFNLSVNGGKFTGDCVTAGACNRGGNGACSSLPVGFANCSYLGSALVETYPAQAGRAEVFFNNALPVASAGAANGNNGGGGSGFGPFQPISSDESQDTAGSGFRGRFAGAGGGGNVGTGTSGTWGTPAGKGAGGLVRIRW